MKYEKILNKTWEFLENTYKGSEITIMLWINLIEKECDSKNCLKKCIQLLWSQWEWYDDDEKEYWKKYIKDNYNISLV